MKQCLQVCRPRGPRRTHHRLTCSTSRNFPLVGHGAPPWHSGNGIFTAIAETRETRKRRKGLKHATREPECIKKEMRAKYIRAASTGPSFGRVHPKQRSRSAPRCRETTLPESPSRPADKVGKTGGGLSAPLFQL